MNVKVSSLLPVVGALISLFAGTHQGAFKSTDGGRRWMALSARLPRDTEIYALADDTAAGRIYAGGSAVLVLPYLDE